MTDVIVEDLPDFGLSPVPVATPGRTPRPLNPANMPIQFKNKKVHMCSLYFVFHPNDWLAGIQRVCAHTIPQKAPQMSADLLQTFCTELRIFPTSLQTVWRMWNKSADSAAWRVCEHTLSRNKTSLVWSRHPHTCRKQGWKHWSVDQYNCISVYTLPPTWHWGFSSLCWFSSCSYSTLHSGLRNDLS